MPKYGGFSGPYFPTFGLNDGKYGPEETPYLDTFHAVTDSGIDRLVTKYFMMSNKNETKCNRIN